MIRTALAYAKASPFLAKKYLRGYDLPSTPWFDEESNAAFSRIIKDARVYLEYGCGGSTVAAAQHADLVVSVESDPVYARTVKAVVGDQVQFIVPNIGWTREFGFPVNANPTSRRLERWKQYPRLPWEIFRSRSLLPDLVLIDGRFRAACCLESLAHLTPLSVVLFDDYQSRDYRVVERFADVVAMHGRMAELRRKSAIDTDLLNVALDAQYAVLD